MIAVDTNILVYAHRSDSPWHDQARACVLGLAEGKQPWALPGPCLHEFFGVVTHPRIYDPPTPLAGAIEQVDAWLESPTVVLLAEPADYWVTLRDLLVSGKIVGPRVHDAHIAALCLAHEVSELWSRDRDFSRFPSLKTRSPFR
ncbi:MAG: PIN domain-containing protein [Polyangiaceae bacterium]|nr:PIN domain-containing protein [Polyangiaceae bacterium]